MEAVAPAQGTRAQILEVATRCFADQGFAATSLNEIADQVGIRRPSLLHHFPSKLDLYKAVIMQTFGDWFELVEDAVQGTDTGWPQVERVLNAAFVFFEQHPEFVRLARREAIDGGPVLSDELGELLRPQFERAVAYFEREMESGRLRRYDARHLLLTGYGAILSWFSDAPLATALLAGDPLSPEWVEAQRREVIELFRNALKP
ncbi:MAG TPA: TetR/AcrR family transcriptional regulator [Acidimicrobiia bacterium]|nr:TetR/AcrR family transcriptional regulator [Acidimicrobiia bacterium]